MAYDFPIKRLLFTEVLTLHLKHKEKFAKDLWLNNGNQFIVLNQKVLENPKCVAKRFLSKLIKVKNS
ncbi:MAG: hypothetical protein QGH93_06050, partial [Gammaproteobacteria bacterium]|nr:hypothetical protein [Gammaproteobacteria bacterium]